MTMLRDALARPRRLPAGVEGALLMVGSCACFAAMSALIRYLSTTISPFEVAFFRNAVGLVVLLPWMMHIGFGTLRTNRLKLYLSRGSIGMVAMWAWYSALGMMPLAEAITLNFTVALWMIPIAIVLLRERVDLIRWLVTGVGFAGVLIVLQPGAETFSLGGLLAIGSASLFALSMCIIKLLSKTESPTQIVFYMNLIMTPLSIGPAVAFWSTPSALELGLLCAIGIIALIGHFSMARALSLAEASALVPLDFTRLPFAILIGYFAFGEFPGVWTWVGGAIIIASAAYLSLKGARECRALVRTDEEA
ncbi:MAG: DMT family transporter [Alphaproteobacteria bacterium]|nr:DMT family transporter [Alphaproteobacteria bacterium]